MGMRAFFALSFGTRRLVRCHLIEGPSIDGYLVTKTRGHYIMEQTRAWLHEDDREPTQFKDSHIAEIPKENVSFFEVLR